MEGVKGAGLPFPVLFVTDALPTVPDPRHPCFRMCAHRTTERCRCRCICHAVNWSAWYGRGLFVLEGRRPIKTLPQKPIVGLAGDGRALSSHAICRRRGTPASHGQLSHRSLAMMLSASAMHFIFRLTATDGARAHFGGFTPSGYWILLRMTKSGTPSLREFWALRLRSISGSPPPCSWSPRPVATDPVRTSTPSTSS